LARLSTDQPDNLLERNTHISLLLPFTGYIVFPKCASENGLPARFSCRSRFVPADVFLYVVP
jgi:hypothetical protein